MPMAIESLTEIVKYPSKCECKRLTIISGLVITQWIDGTDELMLLLLFISCGLVERGRKSIGSRQVIPTHTYTNDDFQQTSQAALG